MSVLQTRAESVRGEIARADTKAAALLSLSGTILTLLLGIQALRLPTIAAWTAGASAVLIAAAAIVLALVLRPAFGARTADATPTAGWIGLVAASPDTVLRAVRAEASGQVDLGDHAADLQYLARLAWCKYRRLRAAVHLLIGGLALTALAVALTVLAG
jgi:hypothetical protein